MTTVLLATDADWIFDEVDAALGDDTTTVYRVRAGVDVVPACRSLQPDLVVIDMQIGNMGGMAACMNIRHEELSDRLSPTAVLMLLDRAPDMFLAQRCDTDGWLVKPLDAFRLRRAADALLAGGDWYDGHDPAGTASDGDAPADSDTGQAADDAEQATADAS